MLQSFPADARQSVQRAALRLLWAAHAPWSAFGLVIALFAAAAVWQAVVHGKVWSEPAAAALMLWALVSFLRRLGNHLPRGWR